MEDKLTGLVIGRAYVFKWLQGQQMTGLLVAVRGRNRWCTLRTGKNDFVVPPQDVLHEAE